MSVLYETERLLLRLPRVADAPELVRFYVENRDHLQPWSPTFPVDFFSEPFWREQARMRRLDFQAGREIRPFLFARQRPQRVIGQLSLTQITRGALEACTLGYALASDAQGRGYMVEAVRGAVAYAFQELGLHRIMAAYMPRNRRSATVLRRAGFTVEGYARDYLLIDGRWEDHVMTAITNPRWRRG